MWGPKKETALMFKKKGRGVLVIPAFLILWDKKIWHIHLMGIILYLSSQFHGWG